MHTIFYVLMSHSLTCNDFHSTLLSRYTVPLKSLKGTGGWDKWDSFFVPHRKALHDVNALSVKHKVVV